jgi:hypothetical protein
VPVNNYSAEYGRSTGGIVTAVTRSGTNAFHGTGFEFTRNSRFDSRTYFDDPDRDIPPLTRNQFGGYLGVPIAKERTFLFGSYEGLRQDRGLTTIATVPSRATRTRADISPVTQPYLLLYPEPNGKETGATGTYSVQVTSPTHENYALGKIDHTFSAAHALSVRYSYDRAQVDQDQPIPYWMTDTRTQSQSVVGSDRRRPPDSAAGRGLQRHEPGQFRVAADDGIRLVWPRHQRRPDHHDVDTARQWQFGVKVDF